MKVQWATALVAVAFIVAAVVLAVVGPEEHRGVAVQAVLSTGVVIAALMNRIFPSGDGTK